MKHFLIVAGFFLGPLLLVVALTNGWFQADEPNHAPIINAHAFKVKSQTTASDPWIGTIDTMTAFLEDRRFRDCGPRCIEEVDANGNALSKSEIESRDRANPTCGIPVYSPKHFDFEFAQNEIRAEAIFGHNCWFLSGYISGIETSAFGGARFQLADETGTSIQCHVSEEGMQQFFWVNPGQHVVIKAIHPSRVLGGVVFGDCRLKN